MNIKKVLKELNAELTEKGFHERAVLEKNSRDYKGYGLSDVNKKLVINHKDKNNIKLEIVLCKSSTIDCNYNPPKASFFNCAAVFYLENDKLLYRSALVYIDNNWESNLRSIYKVVESFLTENKPKVKRTIEQLYEEVIKDPKPYLLKDIEYPSDYPVFKYFPNPLRTTSVIESSIPCECCGKSGKYSYIAGIDQYAEEEELEEVSNLCLDCIANGEAIKKFGGAFTYKSFIANRTADKSITEEIMYRTPSFTTWQEKEWLSHCKTPCRYIGQVYIGDLLKMSIYKQVRTDLAKTFYYKNMPMTVAEIDDMLIEMTANSSLEGHLFQCTQCGKYRLHTDLD